MMNWIEYALFGVVMGVLGLMAANIISLEKRVDFLLLCAVSQSAESGASPESSWQGLCDKMDSCFGTPTNTTDTTNTDDNS